MGKLKSIKSVKDKKPPKTLSAVKSGAVLKVSKTPQSKSKDMAKKAAAIMEKDGVKGKTDKKDKKSKLKKKEPTPPPVESSEDDSDGSSDGDSDGDSSSMEDGPLVKPSVKGPRPSSAAQDGDDTSESSASSDEESDDEKPAPTKAARSKAASTNGAPISVTKTEPTSSSEEDDSSEGDDNSATDSEVETKGKKAVAAAKHAAPAADLHRNGNAKGMAPVGPAPSCKGGSWSLRSCSPFRRSRSRP